MQALAFSLPVNPPGTSVTLTREHVWAGLVMKAENAVPFVPGMEECAIAERFEGGFTRNILINGRRLTERITLTPEAQVLFERVDADGNAIGGWIANVLSEGEEGLLLTFVLNVASEPGRDLKKQYTAAIAATLKATRELLAARA
jgi:Domain of unknown function (DUF1857)